LALLIAAIVLAVINRDAGNGYLPEPYIDLPVPDEDPHGNEGPPGDENPSDDEDPPEEVPVFLGPLGLLTGLPINEDYLNRRPVAVVVNNHYAALPQSGLLAADVIYEVLAESDITRFVAIFQSEMPNLVGPIRSTRDYFTDMALNHDAIFVIHGGTPNGYSRARNYIDAILDGMVLEPTIFWRDRTYPQWTGIRGQRAMEHSSYSSWERIAGHISQQNMRDTIARDSDFGFNFGEIPRTIRRLGDAHKSVSVPFSATYTRTFTFVPEHNHYLVSNNNGALVDAETQEQLIVQNILVQFVTERVVDTVAGYRHVDTVGNNYGYLFTGGEQFLVHWSKDSHASPMQWHFDGGTPIILTPGKTWINVFPNDGVVAIK
jgi:hypothetical protein